MAIKQMDAKEALLDLVVTIMMCTAVCSVIYVVWVAFFGIHIIDHKGMCMAEIIWQFIAQRNGV